MKKILTGVWWLVVVGGVCADKWRFPDEQPAASLRIDTKVKFTDTRDDTDKSEESRLQADEIPFREPTDTEGFYNRPPGSGRYPVYVQNHNTRAPYTIEGQTAISVDIHNKHDADGTLDSLQHCKCVSSPDCGTRPESKRKCGAGKHLCCYKRQSLHNPQRSEFFNEIDDERPALLPGRPNLARPFPPPPGSEINGFFGPGHAHEVGVIGAVDRPHGILTGPQGPTGPTGNPGVLVGPGGPTGIIGPQQEKRPGLLVGPDGPTGIARPHQEQRPGILVGPGGPTGIIGPQQEQRPGVLVGPNGPTGNIGPANYQEFVDDPRDFGYSESAQRGVLVGPGGPTGIIGPAGYGQRPVLTGPGGPTGVIGPYRNGRRGVLVGPGGPTGVIGPGYNRQGGRGVLVGPGGPTGTIGPGRGILVGPGGPTGQIGPNYYG